MSLISRNAMSLHRRNASTPTARINYRKLCGNKDTSSPLRSNSKDKKLPLHLIAKLDRDLADEELDAKT